MPSSTDHLRQAWVTCVLNKDDVEKALVLGRSFKRVVTTRRLVVITTPVLHHNLKLLSKEFDQVFMLDYPKDDGNGLTLTDYAKLFCFTLQIFQKCVYLDPSSLILQNCDDIFDRYNSFNAVVSNCKTNANAVDSSIFFFVPSMDIYETLVTTMKNKRVSCKATFEQYLKAWMMNQQKDFEFMDPKYNRKIGVSNDGPIAEEEDKISIIHFHNDLKVPNGFVKQPTSMERSEHSTLGTIEYAVVQLWLSLYESEVEPLLSLVDENQPTTGITRGFSDPRTQLPHESIAIVGMSCRYPGASNLDEFWELLIQGGEAVQKVPSNRWTDDRCVLTKPDERNTHASFLNVPVDEFDGKFFGISPKELEFLDPQQRFLLEVTWEALEDAAINPLTLRGTHTGVFSGAWMYDYKDQLLKAGTDEFYRTYMGNSFGAAAARISFLLGLLGPSIATESGCSSAMVAIDLAIKSLRNGESSMAIACGVNLLLSPFTSDDISFVVSPDGRCKTFDESADGFGRAEGCGVLILKRFSEAVKDGDRIWGLIRGSSAAQEGLSRSIGTPTRFSEGLAMKLALEDAGVAPNQVSYVETHGTGTKVGDPMEIAAISDVYSKGRQEPLIIGSVKTNIGHTESCSAMPGIMKVILSMKNQVIPPHRNLTKLNPAIDLDAIPAEIPDKPIPWKKDPGKKRLAGVSSFGITGTDGHLILEEAPEECRKPGIDLQTDRLLHILTLSGKTEQALDNLVERYQDVFAKSELNFADVCYTANVGRAAFSHRAAIIAGSLSECKDLLASGKFLKQEAKQNLGKVCFLFTGQGSQYHGMAKSLYESSPVFRLNFEKCAKLLETSYQIDIRDAVWNKDNAEELSRTIYSQTSVFCVEYCLLKLWESWGFRPDYVLGHSLGEFTAAVTAGILTLEDGIKLVAERSKLIDSLPRGKMLVIKANQTTVHSLLNEFLNKPENTGKWLDIAALNSSDQTVYAGDGSTVEEFSTYCQTNNLKTHVLEATHAFHSRHMNPILPEYERIIASGVETGKSTEVKYISAVDGKLLSNPASYMNAQYWCRHTRDKVNFLQASKIALEEGCTTFVEIGPHPVLSALIIMNNEENCTAQAKDYVVCLPSIRRSQNDWQVILNSLAKLYLAGYDVNWKGFDQYIGRAKVEHLPFYPFQRKKHWFERNDKGVLQGKRIHPLLGCVIPNATSLQMYQNGINLKNLEYLRDHAIGGKVVFPGAGYLEMCLSAGHATTQCFLDSFSQPGSPLVLKDLKILKPLLLENGKTCHVQAVVDCSNATTKGPDDEQEDDDSSSSTGMKVQIFAQLKHDSELPQWIPHATAQFCPVASNSDLMDILPLNLENIKQSSEPFSTDEFYGKLAKVGLEFGPVFKSLSNGWKLKDGILVQTNNINNNNSGYIVHPAVFDAMIQVAMIAGSKGKQIDKLHVPVSISKVVWLETGKSTADSSLYIFCTCSEDGHVTSTILYDPDGTPLALMEGVELIQTNVEQIESLLDNSKNDMPPLWEEVWTAKGLGPWEKRVDPEGLSPEYAFKSQFSAQFAKFDDAPEADAFIQAELNRIVYLYILDAFYCLGWRDASIQVGSEFKLEQLMDQLHVSTIHSKLMNYFLEILKQENIIENMSDCEQVSRWVVVVMPPDKIQVQHEISSIEASLLQKSCCNEEFQVVSACGKNLPTILKGEDSGLRLLFPEDQNAPSAGKFYAACYARRKVFEMVTTVLRSCLESLCEASKQRKDILRIIEIGAGTGSFTQQVLSALDSMEIGFEYTYTDISPAFFSKAERKFESHAKNLKFKALNVEMDPALQGFSPGYYDLVIAGDVIHATQSLQKSVSNVRKLLRPRGSFWLLECTKPCREITLVFGLLEGYWQFTDFDVRPDHALVSAATWENVMKESGGFSRTTSVNCFAGNHGLIMGKASEGDIISFNESRLTTDIKTVWLLFFGKDTPVDSELSSKLQSKLIFGNKTPILVCQSDKFNCDLDSGICTVRKNANGDLNSLITQVTSNGDTTLEGVIYGWGLVTEDNISQNLISQPYLYLIQILSDLKVKKTPKVLLITEGIVPAGGAEHAMTRNPSAGSLWGISKSFHNEYPNFPKRCIDLCGVDSADTKVQQVFSEIWIDDSETMVAYRDNKRLCARLASTTLSTGNIPLPNSSGDRFKLILPESKSFTDLKFGPLSKCALKENEVEIQVKATALNFRDVFAVLKPISYFEDVNKVGLDIAGVISNVGPAVSRWKIGDAVFGCNLSNTALPSHLNIGEDAVVAIPSQYSFAEAATLPAVFATSYYSLIMLANLKRAETVLIHTASGGVGLSSIQIAQHVGAKIIGTAGSARKRTYLRALGIEHVFHSRDTSYEEEILKVTGGKGVDVVLNSLTGPGFKEATLNVCARNARFVEMSKLSIWKPEEVRKMRPDVDYTAIDLTECPKGVWDVINEKMDEFLKSGIARPIPYERFDAVNICGALTYLQKAKQIGKVVCIMPEFKLEKGRMLTISPLFNSRSTYLVTGGLGGIGLEVAKWMSSHGAKHLVLVGRSKPDDATAEVIQRLNAGGHNNVISYSADVGNFEQCKGLMDFIKSPDSTLPPLRGIMHAAGVLQDAIICNQTWEKFEATYLSKVLGTWNLHRLTQGDRLEHFVMFSSIAGIFGPPGQSNHAASNAFLDAFASFRQSQGLPATSINWGAWSQVGVAAGKEFPGLKPFSPQRGLYTLEQILREQLRTQICVADLQMSVFKKFFVGVHTYMEKVFERDDTDKGTRSKSSYAISSDKFWTGFQSAETNQDKIAVIKESIKYVIREILKFDKNETLDETSSFQDMGLDSLMMVEMKNLLQGILGKRVAITANDLKDCNNIELLAQRLYSVIEGQTTETFEQPAALEKMSSEEFVKLIREDSQLPQHIRHVSTNSTVDLPNCRTFLLTGVTGNLGPYFIRDIFRYTTVSRLYCLVRAKNTELATQRLCSVLKERDLLQSVDLTKISCIPGDLTLPKFGLQDDAYDSLAAEVDAVLHCAVKASHVEMYAKAPSTNSRRLPPNIRAVNVEGTIAILEFACHKKTKHVLHASTLLAVTTTDENGSLSETWPKVDDFDNITQFGYPVSKFVCDLLMKEAVLERGIPCKVFRFPGITGDSKTGRFSAQNNHLLLRLLSYLRLRAMPSVPLPVNIVGADLCAQIALEIFFRSDAPPDIYNVCQLKPQHEQEFVNVAKEFGFNVEIVDFQEFVKKLEEEGEGSLLYTLRDIYLDEDHFVSLFFAPQAIQSWFSNPDEFFSSKKLLKYADESVRAIPSTTESIRKDLYFAKREGIFEKFGVK